jgi:putative oxidoreductase
MPDAAALSPAGEWARKLGRVIGAVDPLAARIPQSLVQIVLRVAVAIPFLRSGLLKWDGFLNLTDTAVHLFREEFRLHLFGALVPFPAPAAAAFLAGLGEVCLPILLIMGLATRFAALGLLFMSAVIQLTVPGGWPIHLIWAAMLLAVLAYGPGRLSFDHFLARGGR